MSANPIEENSTPKATGSLEELFRHHLGSEAAVPPRPMLWDQIDNSLLMRQNETYRRRLAATRWVAAASLLLATLAGAGWWARRDASFGPAEMATTTGAFRNRAAAGNGGVAGNQQPAIGTDAQKGQAAGATAATTPSAHGAPVAGSSPGAGTATASSVENPHLATRSATHGLMAAANAGRNAAFGPSSIRSSSTANALNTADAALNNQTAAARAAVDGGTPSLAVRTYRASTFNTSEINRYAHAAGSALNLNGTGTGVSVAAVSASAAPAGLALGPAASVAGPEQVGLLAARPAALMMNELTTLPNGLAALPLPAAEPVSAIQKWHYGARYTAGIFNPNINFSRAGIEPEFGYNPALGSNSPALSEAAAAQYRQNLRPGFSQRLALLATRHLAGRWSLSTGAEISQATARSASSLYFVGEQVNDIGQRTTGPLLATDFRYRMAGIPLEVCYANPVKRGWSLYGRLGGVVTALLGVRAEATGDPEATRTYSITSAGTPYRRVLGTVRGAAGLQYRPAAGHWTLTAGPTAEVGTASLNAHPAQDFLHESRPYGLGLEMGVEFGK